MYEYYKLQVITKETQMYEKLAHEILCDNNKDNMKAHEWNR